MVPGDGIFRGRIAISSPKALHPSGGYRAVSTLKFQIYSFLSDELIFREMLLTLLECDMKEMEIVRKAEENHRDDMTLRQPRETCLPN